MKSYKIKRIYILVDKMAVDNLDCYIQAFENQLVVVADIPYLEGAYLGDIEVADIPIVQTGHTVLDAEEDKVLGLEDILRRTDFVLGL